MSRIGKLPVVLPQGVTCEIQPGNVVTVKGPKGTLTRELSTEVTCSDPEHGNRCP